LSAFADRIRGIVNPSRREAVDPAAARAGQRFAAEMAARTAERVSPARGAFVSQPVDDGDRSEQAAALLGGEWRDDCLVVERRWTASARHGGEPVRALAARLTGSAAEASFFAGGAPARAPFVFFDLETTGLSGGAGTYVFLVGTGWFDGDEFVVRQYLMVRHTGERAMLRRVARDCERAGTLVSFNGKSFDAPVLETRYLYHRMDWFGGTLPHIDVLHPARQFWKRDDCSLGALEGHVLGHRRRGDLQGFEVPARYFHFVRTGDPRPLAGVLEHNRLDLLSLAALAGRLLDLARGGPAASHDAREAIALGHLYARAGMDARAREAYARALTLSRAPRGAFDATRIDALRALAFAWRRARRFEQAAECWHELLSIRGCPAAIRREAAEALAIHSEHRLRDFAAARAYVVDRFGEWPAGRKRQAIEYRLRRLERKIADRGLRIADLFNE
jgi:uncharacterized protein YprB with RNaseH-like and TPR domain